jgi:hypothetical protein
MHPLLRYRTIFSVLTIVIQFADLTVAEEREPTRDAVLAAMRPFEAPATNDAVRFRSSLAGTVLCGYQGWFGAKGDASERGWRHYGKRRRFEPGECSIDLWPDLSEFDFDERFPTAFRHADGRVADVFSSSNAKTIDRHFTWMEAYGIDGVFVQRFAVETIHPLDLRHCNTVLTHVREAANRHARSYAVMYDLSSLPKGGTQLVVDDWKLLVDRMKLGRDEQDRSYLVHNDKPVVAVWGIGFNDKRQYTLAECGGLIDFLKHDPVYGGNTVIVGVPTGWRTGDADSVRDDDLVRVIAQADIVSPWTVGRYATIPEVEAHALRRWRADRVWCQDNEKEYLPVVFPGFSWHNMQPEFPINQIPRQKGKFFWRQLVEAKKAGAAMVYVAMFDELDEGTAIFKCTNDVPVGESRFVDYEGLPSDHYLWLTGQGSALLRGGVPPSVELPRRPADK